MRAIRLATSWRSTSRTGPETGALHDTDRSNSVLKKTASECIIRYTLHNALKRQTGNQLTHRLMNSEPVLRQRRRLTVQPQRHPLFHVRRGQRQPRRGLRRAELRPPLQGRLVVRQLPRQQPERVVPERRTQELRRRHQLVHVDRIQLLAEEDSHEDEAAD